MMSRPLLEKGRALRDMGIVLNAPYLGGWADKIGRFILNFGGIELLSYQQLLLLEGHTMRLCEISISFLGSELTA